MFACSTRAKTFRMTKHGKEYMFEFYMLLKNNFEKLGKLVILFKEKKFHGKTKVLRLSRSWSKLCTSERLSTLKAIWNVVFTGRQKIAKFAVISAKSFQTICFLLKVNWKKTSCWKLIKKKNCPCWQEGFCYRFCISSFQLWKKLAVEQIWLTKKTRSCVQKNIVLFNLNRCS